MWLRDVTRRAFKSVWDKSTRNTLGFLRATLAAGPVGVLETKISFAGANLGTTPRYWHRDHLGSTTVVTDEGGNPVNSFRYDPWGKPLFTLAQNNPQSATLGTGNRGFTGHEHLVGGLIHMNGRIYDPVLGRFLSPDIVVQMPHNIQSYNRYSYVLNNPLIATDPSGYIPLFVVAALWAAAFGAVAYAIGDRQIGRALFGLAVAFLLGPNAALGNVGIFGAGNGFFSAIAAGFASGGISSGNVRGAISGALSAGLFYGAGSFADGALASEVAQNAGSLGEAAELSSNSVWSHGGIGRAGLHAIAGCAGALAGGKCGPGALSAGFAEFAGPKLDGLKVPGIVSRVIVGGIAAELGGGKFANGAMTAAFGYLFNFLAHRTDVPAGVDPATKETRYSTTYKVDFASDEMLALAREVAAEASPGKRLELLFAFRDRLQDVAPGGWGTSDIDTLQKVAAYKFDPILKNIYFNAGYTLGQDLTQYCSVRVFCGKLRLSAMSDDRSARWHGPKRCWGWARG